MKKISNLSLFAFIIGVFCSCENNSKTAVSKDANDSSKIEKTATLQTDKIAANDFVASKKYVYTGYIDKFFFTMKLDFKETEVAGYYFYKDRKKQIFLEGSFENGNLKLMEVADDNPELFTGTGKLDKSEFSGIWQKDEKSDSLDFSFRLPPKDAAVDYTKELANLLAFYKDSTITDTFPKELADLFLAKALEGEYTFAYSDEYLYTKVKIEYENENFVALSFNKEGDTGYHLLDVDFILTINKKNGQIIQSTFVGSDTDYEWHFQRGYNKSEHIEYTIQPINNERLVFRVLCKESSTFYNFNTDYEKDEALQKEPKQNSTLYFEVDTYGRFSSEFEK